MLMKIKNLKLCENKYPGIVPDMFKYSGQVHDFIIPNNISKCYRSKTVPYSWHKDWLEPISYDSETDKDWY